MGAVNLNVNSLKQYTLMGKSLIEEQNHFLRSHVSYKPRSKKLLLAYNMSNVRLPGYKGLSTRLEAFGFSFFLNEYLYTY